MLKQSIYNTNTALTKPNGNFSESTLKCQFQRWRPDACPGVPEQRVLQRARGGAAALHDPLPVRGQVRQVPRGRRGRRQGRNFNCLLIIVIN